MAKQLPPVSLRLPPALLLQFDAYCTKRRRKRGEMVRMLIEDAIAADLAAHPAPAAGPPR